MPTDGKWEARTKSLGYTRNYINSDIGGELGAIIAQDIPSEADTTFMAASKEMYKALEAVLVDAHNSSYTSLTRATRCLIDTALSKAKEVNGEV